MDTPIFDGVLGDRLAAARAREERAGQQAAAFAAALTAGQAQALEQLAQTRAEALAAERTATLAARVEALEQQLRQAQDEREAAVAELEAARAEPATPAVAAPVAEEPAEEPMVEEPAAEEPAAQGPVAEQPVEEEQAVPVEAPAPVVTVLTPREPAATTPPVRAPGRKAADAGPTGEDVPSVPSMKDIFASTRAAGWLDSLLGAKR